MKGIPVAIAASLLLVLAAPRVAHAQLVLRNDGFDNGGQVGVEAGFAAGEEAAARLVAPSAGRTLQKVTLLFGGSAAQQDVTLHVYDDTAGTDTPGSELFTGDFTLTGSDTALNEIDLTGMNVTVPAQFRISIGFQHAGVPSIARDDDGSIDATKNFIKANGIGWVKSSTLGLTGDWILRATVSDAGGTPDAGVGGFDGAPPDGGVGGTCTGNGDCAVGSYCDPATHACTFDCRTAADCGGATCTSLGQCLAGDGGGCCQTSSSSGALGFIGLGALVGLLMLRRRRA
ncbi:MAG: hypothetical protein K8W52_08625 [Deltaproteobacteria bacterium]|nr:hypothetical protein [Deltaproteobacteria bacterium]